MRAKTMIAAASLVHFFAGCSSSIPISGRFIGQQVDTEVKDSLSAYYFHRLNGSTGYNPRFELRLKELLNDSIDQPPSPEKLQFISSNASIDLATLYFAHRNYQLPRNKAAHDLYLQFLNDEVEPQFTEQLEADSRQYAYVFFPGLFYERHPETGGDFRAQREQLERMGLTHYLVEVDEVGLVTANARHIAQALREIARNHEKIIVVSASKGGPDLAYALGKVLTPQEQESVKAWISIGGVLRGSQIADDHLFGFKRLCARAITWYLGTDLDFLQELSRTESMRRYDSLHFRKDLLIIHYVGAPLTNQVSKEVRSNHIRLSGLGPNDGLTTLTDELVSNGVVITELGLDHYYRDPLMDLKAMALLRTALVLLAQKTNVDRSIDHKALGDQQVNSKAIE